MAMSDFQKKKLLHVYNNMYDSNKDGIIDIEDFKCAAEKIKKLHHWGSDDKAFSEAQAKLSQVWEGLREAADKNKDGRVTEEEWLSMWSKTLVDIEAGKEFPDWQKKYLEFMFYANDTSGDGFIDEGEYITIQSEFGNETVDCVEAWRHISESKEKFMISMEDFQNLWKDYFLSNDQEKRGNYLFGLPK